MQANGATGGLIRNHDTATCSPSRNYRPVSLLRSDRKTNTPEQRRTGLSVTQARNVELWVRYNQPEVLGLAAHRRYVQNDSKRFPARQVHGR